jgi:hypothetical protein
VQQLHYHTAKITFFDLDGLDVFPQEVVNAMSGDGTIWSVARGMHVHPALSEVVLKAFFKSDGSGITSDLRLSVFVITVVVSANRYFTKRKSM